MTSIPAPAPEAKAYRDEVKVQIQARYEWHNKGTKAWSTAYNGCLIGAAVLSAIAAVIVKLTIWKTYASDIASLCSAMAALCSTLVAGGGFSRKWRANRMARSKLSQLLIDVDNPTIDLEGIRTSLKRIIQEEDEGILGPS